MIWKANRFDQLVLDVYSAFFNQRRNFQLSIKVLNHAALFTFFPDTKTQEFVSLISNFTDGKLTLKVRFIFVPLLV